LKGKISFKQIIHYVVVYLDGRWCGLFGVVGPLVAYLFTGVSIMLSPWFSWWRNALSDLGHASKSSVAPIFNFGLMLAGLLVLLYAVTALRRHARYTSYYSLASAFMLQLVATFNEVYGSLHFAVSVLFFASLALASIVYAVERRSILAMVAFLIGLSTWVLYWAGVYSAGVAVPEAISTIAVVSWIILSALRIIFSKPSISKPLEKGS